MPNIKSAKKRVLISTEHRERNMAQRSSLKTSLKKAASSIAAGDESSTQNLKLAIKSLDEAATKGIIHKNQAARRKSRLTKKLNSMAK